MPLGQSFSPATNAADQSDPRNKLRRLPVQQALQTVSLSLPTASGGGQPGNNVSQNLLAGSRAGAGGSQPQAQALLNALLGGRAGFGGAGFGEDPNLSPIALRKKKPGMEGGDTTPVGGAAIPGASTGATTPGWRPGGDSTDLPGKIASLLPGGKLPSVPSNVPLPGGGNFQLPPSLKPPANFNVNIPGGGLLDRVASPPAAPQLPSPPPVSFARPDVPRFNTPTSGFSGAGTSNAPPPQYAPAPPPPQVTAPPPQVAPPQPQLPMPVTSDPRYRTAQGGTNWQAYLNDYNAWQAASAARAPGA